MYEKTVIPIGVWEEEKKYWLEKLSGGLSELRLITDFPGSRPYMGKIHQMFLDEEITAHLRRISKNNDLSLFVLLLASFKVLLLKYTGQDEIIVSAPVYGTDAREYNRYVIFRDFLYPDMTFKEVLMEVKQTIAAGYKNQYYPVDRILDLLGKGDKFTLNRVMLLFENIHGQEPGNSVAADTENDIMLSIRDLDGKLEATLTYNAGKFKDDTMQILLKCYSHILAQVLGNTNTGIKDIEWATEEEKKEILSHFNHTDSQYPRNKTITRLFEDQAERTPDSMAIHFYIDMKDIFEELESRETNIDLWDRMAKCRFKKNPFIYQAGVSDSPGLAGYKLLKTHRHNSVVVNGNMLELLNLFDSTRSLEAIFSLLHDMHLPMHLPLVIYPLKALDVIELTYEFKEKPEKFSLEDKETFLALVKFLFNHHLIELAGFDCRERVEEMPVRRDWLKEELDAHIPLNSLLNQDKTLSTARVLFLGDTPGLQTAGLLYMASYLRRNGIKSYCQFYNTDWSSEALKKSIESLLKEIRPQLVAVSMKWFPHIARVLEICKIVKEFAGNELHDEITVVVGGNTASYFAKEVIRCEWVDYVIRGDGEKPLLQLCRGEKNISNCIYKKDGKILERPFDYQEDEHNSREIYLSHLDEIMLSGFAPLPGTFFIYTHKGCGRDCFYCGGCTSANKKIFNRSRLFRRGVEEVRKDICEAKKFTSTFMFDFDTPNVDLLEYCRDIWEGIDLSSHFAIFTNLIPPSPALMALVNQTFKYVYWNLDIASLSERHRKQLYSLGLVKPQPNDDDIRAVFTECERYDNAEVRINLIAGLPYFTMEDMTLSDKMLSCILNRYSCCSALHWARLHAEPGAPIVENAENYGMYSLASSFEDFLKYSRKNFNNKYNVEYYNYPYIYFKDEELNSKISNFYSETNIEVEKYKKHRREKINIFDRMSYRELNEKANRLAGVLREYGVTNNPIVGLITREPREVAVGILGILKAGAAYLPIEPELPWDRKRYMIEDCNLKMVLAGSSCLDPGLLSSSGMTVVSLSHLDLERYRGSNPETNFSSSDLAYTIYTSGTTGNPRGVLVHQRGLVNYTSWRINTYGLNENDVTLEPLSYSFDGFASNFYSSLLSGGILIMVPHSRKGDYRYIGEIVRHEGVTNISLVPGMYEVLVDISEGEDLRSLRFVVLAGERAGKTLLEKSREKNPGIVHINEYGPTEATVTAAARLHMDADNTAVIGRPIANTRIYILDSMFKIVPPGVPGQLCIEGPGVARGYLNNPELTEEKFDFLQPGALFEKTAPGPRKNFLLCSFLCLNPYLFHFPVYKTGDLARWLPEGEIEFLGRIDQQVKIRGFRIELEEIENQLRRHEKVKDAAVMAWDFFPGSGSVSTDKYLCAYVIWEDSLDFSLLKEFLSGKLPGYMIPSYFVQLEKLPLTLNGKLDTKALPLPEIKAECIAPRSAIEKKLVEIWGEVLGISNDKIGINSNFFELGGHSLSANTVAAKIHKEFNVKNFLARIFETPTIESLAEQIKNSVQDEHFLIEVSEEKEYYPLSSAQKRLYILQQIDLASSSYNIPLVIHLGDGVEKERLDNTLQQLIERHESFRTSFDMVSEVPVQRIHREVEFRLEYDENPGSRVEASTGDMMNILGRPFDLSRAPLLRAGLIELGKNDCLIAIDMHHIITDGVSLGILAKEFMRLLKGEEPEPLRICYKDFSAWQNGEKEKEMFRRQEKYWLKEFEGEIPVLNLPTDFPRPVIQSFEGKASGFQLSATESSALKVLALQQDSTQFMVLLGIFVILLAKISGQDDIIVGTPIAGRKHADLDKIVGMFVNTLALRNYPKGDQTYNEFLKSIRKRALEAYENQDYQFEDLVDRVAVNRDTGRNPLFDVMFTFDTVNVPAVDANMQRQQISNNEKIDMESSFNNYESNTSKFDLTLTAREIDRGLLLSFQYCSRLFKQETIARFIAYFKKIVSILVEQPGIMINEIEIISEEEKKQILLDFNDTQGEYSVDKTIHRLFVEQVERTPDRVALVGANQELKKRRSEQAVHPPRPVSLTYRELNERSGQLTGLLIEKGVKPDTIVGIIMERSLEMIIGILGILKTGSAYLPINPKNPVKRSRYLLEDSGVGFLVAPPGLNKEVENVTENWGGEKICLEENPDSQFSGFPGLTPVKKPLGTAEHLSIAYIIYTSGSTGLSKGVPISHANFSPLIHWGYHHLGIGVGERFIQNLSYYFDWSVWEIFLALTTGATLYMIADEIVLNPDLQVNFILENGITVLHITPTHWQYLINVGKKLKTLRYLFIGAEKLTWNLVQKSIGIVPSYCRLYNMYGPTETTIISAVFAIERGGVEKNKKLTSVPIGNPVGNTTLLVLDYHLQLCPIGVRGELCIGGDGLARGYLNRPELTFERFINGKKLTARTCEETRNEKEKEKKEVPGKKNYKLYKTGDIARWLQEGTVEFLGRVDDQVKIRGFRIEPGEVEYLLLKNKKVKEAVVMVREDEGREKFLCAYIVPATAEAFPPGSLAEELKTYLSLKTADFMIPRYFVPMEQIPLNPNGKVDRRALPAPAAEKSTTIAPTQNRLQQKLVEIWADVLMIEQEKVGIESDFFQLGGHSLKATVLVSRIHKRLHVHVPLAEVFKTPTIKELSAWITRAAKNPYMPLSAVEEKEYYRLSSAQKRLYLLQQMETESTGYNIPMVLVLEGQLEREKLEGTFRELIERHESLRTSFLMMAGEPIQRIHKKVEFEMEYDPVEVMVEVMVEVEEEKQEAEGRGQKTGDRKQTTSGKSALHRPSEFIQPFDLSRAPLLRVGLKQEGEQKHILMIDMHHIVTDGTSMELFVKESMALYAGENLPLLKFQYKDYSQWQNSPRQKKAIHAQEQYWLNQFADEVPILNLPLDYPRPKVQSFEGAVLFFEIPGALTRSINQMALDSGATLYMVLLAIYYIFLSKISGQEDIVVGTPIAARRHADLERIIGMFVNTLAPRNYPDGEKTIRDFLEEVKRNTLQAFENQEYQFEDLVEKVFVHRDASRNPLFDTMFVLQNMEVQADVIPMTDLPQLKIRPYEIPHRTSKFDLTLNCYEADKKLRCSFEYCTTLFKKDTIDRFRTYLKQIISVVLTDSNKKISRIEIITAEEKRQILGDFNDTKVEFPREKTIHQLFAEQVEQTPDNTALVTKEEGETGRINACSGEISITYRELNKKSDRFARFLIERGVKPDTIVGVMLERSLEMMVGILGILKAGGAYLPIDPGYPRERIDYMRKDSGAFILIATGDTENPECTSSCPSPLLPLPSYPSGSLNLAYIIYTSGTTGKPKAVMVEHINVLRLVKNTNYIKFAQGDRILQTGALEFDASTFEIWGSLLNGLQLHLVSNEIILSAEKLKQILQKNLISTIWLTSPLFNQLLEQDIEIFGGLRCLLVGGDVLSPVHINRLRNKYPHLHMVNGYGPTENTTFSTTFLIDREYKDRIPIGKPIANSSAYIIDKYDLLQPVGIPGELWVGGCGVARGYLNRPELTKERFKRVVISHSSLVIGNSGKLSPGDCWSDHCLITSDCLYFTGDLARWLPDGNIDFLGRSDQQVKIRGFRIELREIENCMLEHPGINEIIVLVREDNQNNTNQNNKYLCAYFVAGQDVSIAEIRRYLSQKLPDYMVPAYFVLLERIPLTPNGKVDRKMLPKPGIEIGETYMAPGNKIEKKLAAIWSELLSLDKEKISIDADFFQLGGHSLKAAVMTTKVHKEFHVKLPLTEIFKSPTIKALSGYIKDRKRQQYTPIEPIEKKEYYFLSPAQKRLYMQQQMDFRSIAYNMPLFIVLSRELNVGKLTETFKRLIKRHESLRTSFQMIDDQPVQKVHDEVAFEVEYYDLYRTWGEVNVEEGKQATDIKSNIIPSSDFVRAFDLSRTPLLRVGIIPLYTPPCGYAPEEETVEGKHILMVDMHHIISDGNSHQILETEFNRLYQGQELPGLRLQYKDYSHWQNNQANSSYMKNQESYWLKQFTGSIPTLNLPADYPLDEVKNFKGSALRFEISAEKTGQLRRMAADEGVTMFMMIFALFYVLLVKLSGQEDVIIGIPTAGRNHADLEPIIGMFVNTLALRTPLQKEKTFSESLRDVKTRVLEAFENQDYPLEELVERVVKKREPNRSPLFDVMFQLRTLDLQYDGEAAMKTSAGKPALLTDEPDEFLNEFININRIAKYHLIFDGVEQGKKISFSVEYSIGLFKKETITGYVDYFQQIITEVLKKPDIPLKEIKLAEEFPGQPFDNPEITFGF